jgi:hypothetical protein
LKARETHPITTRFRNRHYITGTATIHVVFGTQPAHAAPNTLYTGSLTSVFLFYRIYFADNPANLPGGPANVATLPAPIRKAVMGTYYPTIGYCTTATFAQYGASCIEQ